MTSYNDLDIQLTADVATLKADMGHVKDNVSKALGLMEEIAKECRKRGACPVNVAPAATPAVPSPYLSGKVWGSIAGFCGFISMIVAAMVTTATPSTRIVQVQPDVIDHLAKIGNLLLKIILAKP